MRRQKGVSAISAAASQLRALVADTADGAFLGGETELQQIVGVSRTTLRQVARLLEREGLLTVKRGTNGGYFASRPSFASIEAALTAYLEERLLARTSGFTLSTAHHGPADDHKLDYEASYIIRGLEQLHIELAPA